MRRSDLVLAAAAAIAIAALAGEGSALAFCRTSSCAVPGSKVANTGQTCTPSEAGDCGIPLAWPNPCVGYSIQKDASKQVSFSTVEDIVRKAFSTWMSAPCKGGSTPHISVKELDPVECNLHEYNQKVGNANTIMFRDTGWPYEGSSNTLALTTVTYNLDNGEIYDADMELNSTDAHFTIGDSMVQVDLLSVVTHEAGHFLGLAHSFDATATMFPAYKPGDISLRDLSNDDIAGICDIYPPGDAIPASCDATPRHGFSTLCAEQQIAASASTTSTSSGGDSSSSGQGCCAVAPGSPAGNAGGALALAAIGVTAVLTRRRRRAG